MKNIFIIVGVVVAAGLLIWGVGGFSGGVSPVKNWFSGDGDNQAAQNAEPVFVGEDNAGKVEAVAKPAVKWEGGAKKYTHIDPAFSFEYPADFTVGSFKDAEGETILMRYSGDAKDATGAKREFQIYLSPQDEDFAVTKEKILADAPEVVVDNPQTVSVGQTQGLFFASKSASLGATAELWFERAGWLYQITGYPESADVMKGLAGTWAF